MLTNDVKEAFGFELELWLGHKIAKRLLLQQTEVFEWHEGVQFCNLADIVCMCNTAIECELVRREQTEC